MQNNQNSQMNNQSNQQSSQSGKMSDRDLMETLLNTTKGACDLYLHGTIESATPNVHKAFDTVLTDTLCMQNEIYAKMSAKGWYPAQNADQQQVQQVKTQYANKA